MDRARTTSFSWRL
jgi:15-cis-phytoene desaturase